MPNSKFAIAALLASSLPIFAATGERACSSVDVDRSAAARVRVAGASRIRLMQVDGGRMVCAAEPASSLLLPRGKFIALGLDAQGDVESISRPFRAPAEISLARPQLGSDVVVTLSGAGNGTTPLLHDRAPDVRIEQAEELIAVWFGVEDRVATLTVRSERSFLEPMEIRTRPRAVTAVRGALRPLPSLRVNLEAPGDAVQQARLRIRQEGETSPQRERTLTNEREVRFELLQPAAYTIELVLPEWTATARADLTSGADFDTTIELSPIAIRGRITRNGAPVQAQVSLRYGANRPRTETDDRGEYSLRVWTAGRYQVQVTPAAPAGSEPYLDMLLVTADQTYDLDLPDNRVTLLAVDATTQRPIAGANINVHSIWKDPKQGNRGVMRDVKTGADGIAILPPVQPGEITLRARADGYLEGEALPVTIPAGEHEQQIVLQLTSEQDAAPLSIVLPNGAPAAGAELIALRDPAANGATLWRARTDERGIVRIPRSLNDAYVLVRHDAAAGMMRRWQSQAADTWSLRSPAAPLVVHARDGADQPAVGARVTAWLDGMRVSGDALAFLTWSHATTEGNGVWIAKNLPAAPLRVLLGPAGNTHDALATVIDSPWSGPRIVKLAN